MTDICFAFGDGYAYIVFGMIAILSVGNLLANLFMKSGYKFLFYFSLFVIIVELILVAIGFFLLGICW